ncbi:Uncharacterised protein [Serratia fonticola]|uniref:hypothetical protein n=1 Tax=Serratia fonticola TaxID=47917 RepID=UPI00217C8ACF|nr:hypothetical protein [Serratia fonticola]CAI1768354.1 Uncharacterised protein [Serratia fonticola]
MTGFTTALRENATVITPVLSIFCLLLGAWLGNKYALNRYRLEKFNAVANPIEIFLESELRRVKADKTGSKVSQVDFYALSIQLSHNKRQAYEQAIDNYLAAVDPYGAKSFFDVNLGVRVEADATAAIEKLLTFVRHR